MVPQLLQRIHLTAYKSVIIRIRICSDKRLPLSILNPRLVQSVIQIGGKYSDSAN